VVGRPGRQILHQKLPQLVRDRQVHLVIANAENIAGGSGITPSLFNKIRSYGVDVVTLGDHAFRRHDILPLLSTSDRIIRPANLSQEAAGNGSTVVNIEAGEDHPAVSVGVFTLLGRIFVNLPADDPFRAANRLLTQFPSHVRIIIGEIHAEATSEKVAMGHWLDGRCSLLFGTHTHIPTADATILPGGTGYISDLGMTGPYDSVLGRRKDRVLKYMTTAMPQPFDVATGDVRLCGVLAEIDEKTGKTVAIERIEVKGDDADAAYDADDGRHGRGE
jgi:metallophosphoesterase (TIGR00282 family)